MPVAPCFFPSPAFCSVRRQKSVGRGVARLAINLAGSRIEKAEKISSLLMLRRIVCIVLLIATAVPGYAQTNNIEEWRKQMVIRLNSNKGFLPMAPGQSGTVKVGFVIDRTGKLVSNWLAESTGNPAIDARALAIVERSQPFPVQPPELDDDRLSLIVPFIFQARPASGAYHTIEQEDAAVNAKMRNICRGC